MFNLSKMQFGKDYEGQLSVNFEKRESGKAVENKEDVQKDIEIYNIYGEQDTIKNYQNRVYIQNQYLMQ
ncbi:unnamed protein product [Paramecium sonneborni]|uniref:Uncharacterized protein n=1 Tax=Paramecium sonneborni TaxID=65129 RepID=A0A8S1QHN5_9CILI|nr:unnamed protein product [Paramecium sonneborni]